MLTEREFKERVEKRFHTTTECMADAAAAVAREAGLEFAPEPVVIPEALEYGSTSHGWDFWPALGAWASTEQRVETVKVAVARYNAYPGLRAAVGAFSSKAHRLGTLEAALGDLLAELAKGPK